MEKESFGWQAIEMTRIKLFVEGQTEETFVRDVLGPHFQLQGKWLTPILAKTSSTGRGGIVSYGKVKNQVTRLCREDSGGFVTTMIDLFRLPKDFPGRHDKVKGNYLDRASYLEQQFLDDINEPNFIPNLQVHEFEGLLFSDPEKFGEWFDDSTVNQIAKVRKSFNSPEEINDGPDTAPSKRIENIEARYDKTLHGPLIGYNIGLDVMRGQCTHFSKWLTKLESL